MPQPIFFRPVQWGLFVLVALALVGSTASRGAPPPPTDCSEMGSGPLPPTFSGLRLALQFPPCRSPYRLPRAAEPSGDQWLARDKARHVVFSGLWTLSTQYVLVNKADWSEADALPASIASGAAVGLSKELYDSSLPNGRVSGKDLVADALGIALAVGIVSL